MREGYGRDGGGLRLGAGVVCRLCSSLSLHARVTHNTLVELIVLLDTRTDDPDTLPGYALLLVQRLDDGFVYPESC